MDRKETEMERMLVHRGDPWTPSNKTTVLVSRHAVMSCLKEDETGMSVDFCWLSINYQSILFRLLHRFECPLFRFRSIKSCVLFWLENMNNTNNNFHNRGDDTDRHFHSVPLSFNNISSHVVSECILMRTQGMKFNGDKWAMSHSYDHWSLSSG